MSLLLWRAALGAAAGGAAWLALGSAAIAPGGDGLVTRGLMPSVWLLVVLAGLVAWVAVRWRVSSALLALSCLAVLPWLFPHRVTAIWAPGAPALLLWAFVVAALLPSARLQSRRVVLTGAATVVVLFAWAVWPSPLTGDQPHYLMISTSVVEDGDLDLTNDYQENRQLPFYPGRLEPWHVVLSPNGRQYSFHGLGVALLTLPAFALAGASGVKLMLLAITLLGVWCLFRAADVLTHSPAASAVAVMALVAQLPFLAQAAAIYPEGPAAAITSLALLTLFRLEKRETIPTSLLVATGAALALLPWLHFRLGIIAACFGLATLWLLRRTSHATTNQLVFMAAPMVSAALLLASTFVMFETWDPTAAFRQKATGSLAAAPLGLVGMLTDVEYGLLIYAPALAWAVIGAPRMARLAPVTTVAAWAATLMTLLTGASYVWWGGTSAPSRFLVSVMPVMAVAVGASWPALSRYLRAVCGMLVALALAVSAWVAVAYRGRYVANVPDGRDTIFEWANPLVDVQAGFPSLFRPGARPEAEVLLAIVWLSVGIAIFGGVRALTGGEPRRAKAIAAWSIVGWIVVSLSINWTLRRVEPLRADASQLALLQLSSRDWLRVGFSGDGGFGPPAIALEGLEFAAMGPGADVLLNAPMLPAGRYQVVQIGDAVGAEHALELGRNAWAIVTWSRSEEAPTFAIALPLHSIRIATTRGAPASVGMRLRTLAVHRDARLPVADRVTRYGGLFVYSLDAAIGMTPDAVRLRGGRTSRILLTDQNSATMPAVRLTLRADAAAHVSLRRGAWRSDQSLDSGREVVVNVPAGDNLAPLEVHVNGNARGEVVSMTVAPAEPQPISDRR